MAGMSGMGAHMGVTRGNGVFLSAGCGACHTFAAAGTKATVGPNLDTTLKGKSSAFIRQSILDPDATIAAGYRAGVMPTSYRSQLTMRQIADLVAFLVKQAKSSREHGSAHAGVAPTPAAVVPVCCAPDADAHEVPVARPQPAGVSPACGQVTPERRRAASARALAGVVQRIEDNGRPFSRSSSGPLNQYLPPTGIAGRTGCHTPPPQPSSK